MLRELHAIRQTIRDEREASGKLFKGQFGSGPEPRPQADATSASPTSGGGGLRRRVGGQPHTGPDAAEQRVGASSGMRGSIMVLLQRLLHWLTSLFSRQPMEVTRGSAASEAR